MALPNEPITRQEMYLSNIAGQNTPLPDTPITREEMYLDYIAKTGGTGEGDMKKSIYDSDNSVASAGGIKMFVNQKIGTLPQRVGSLETTAGVLEGEVASIEDTLDSLGTASTKNSTSVVTDSTDLVESGAVKDIVGWGNKNGFDLSNISTGESYFTSSQKGKVINIANPTAGTYKNTAFLVSVKPNTDMHIVSNVSVSSGVARISVSTADNVTEIASSGAITSETVDLSFNTGNNTVLLIKVYCTTSTSELGNVTYTDMMLLSESETDLTYEPYHASVEETIPQVVSDAVGWEVNNEFKLTTKSGASSGLTYRIDNDGVFLNGTTTAQVSLDYATVRLKAGTYTYTDDAVTSDSTYFMNVVPDPTILSGNLNINTKPLKFTLNQSATLVFKLYIRSGQTFNNEIVFKPKLVHVSVDESKCDNTVIAPVENGSTASQAYAVGEHFIRDGAFCTCTQAISQGGSFTLNTNYTAGDVAGVLKLITISANADLEKLNEGLNAVKITSLFTLGNYTTANNMRGYITREGVNLAGWCIDYNMSVVYMFAGYTTTGISNAEKVVFVTSVESACTNLPEGVTPTINKLVKFGKVVTLYFIASGITKGAWTTFMNIPEGFRPAYNFKALDSNNNNRAYIMFDGGYVQCSSALSDNSVEIHATWVTK